MNTPREGIAIIGMAGRFPQARTFEEFWRNLSEGRDCVTDYYSATVGASCRARPTGRTTCT
jgi:acyl transferase domain-containing protein